MDLIYFEGTNWNESGGVWTDCNLVGETHDEDFLSVWLCKQSVKATGANRDYNLSL